MTVTGVDACRDGWVAVDLDMAGWAGVARDGLDGDGVAPDGGAVVDVRFNACLAGLLAGSGPREVVAVDMPLGLLPDGWRAADVATRSLLGARRNCLFVIPPAPVWQEASYQAALANCRSLTGRGFSVQAWGLRRRLLEAEQYRSRCRHPLYEAHPELSLCALAGAPMRRSKHTADGYAERRKVLAAAGIVVPTATAGRLRRFAVDVLDAAAVAWTAHRIAVGRARVLPEVPQRDAHGREVAIRY